MKPTALHVPYEVSQPRLPIVKKQLDDMESKGIISKVTVPTDWCSGMVQVPKEDPTQIRICADLTKLNQAVKRDTHPSSSVESTLAKISGAKFNKSKSQGIWLAKKCYAGKNQMGCIWNDYKIKNPTKIKT